MCVHLLKKNIELTCGNVWVNTRKSSRCSSSQDFVSLWLRLAEWLVQTESFKNYRQTNKKFISRSCIPMKHCGRKRRCKHFLGWNMGPSQSLLLSCKNRCIYFRKKTQLSKQSTRDHLEVESYQFLLHMQFFVYSWVKKGIWENHFLLHNLFWNEAK